MKDGSSLIYVPILHAQDDAGSRTSLLTRNDRNEIVRRKIDQGPSAVDEMWEGIAAKVEGLSLPWDRVRIYQDGLPVCGNELEVVTRLAANGCRSSNYILKFIRNGAAIEGTEDMELLIKEYDLLNQLLMKRSGVGQQEANTLYQASSRSLLVVRDQFIFNRIVGTLQPGELPLVFMGVMHRLDKMLEQAYSVAYVIYRLPFRSIGAIYNA
jgi:hypothetical protein